MKYTYESLLKEGIWLNYITHVENLPSILANGILSRNQARKKNLIKKDWSSEVIQKRRMRIFGSDIHDFVPLYFSMYPPVLYTFPPSYPLAIIEIDFSILKKEGVLFSNKNIAHNTVKIFNDLWHLDKLEWKAILRGDSFSSPYYLKEYRMAEALIPDIVETKYFLRVNLKNEEERKRINELTNFAYEEIIVTNPHRFPIREKERIDWTSPCRNIEYIFGDIFSSSADALVNPVNCMGVMGKGLALMFKKKYPDMFKDYQRACKFKILKIGKLHFYYAWDGKLIINFPTKYHFKEKSRLEYIKRGLIEFNKEIKNYDVRSVAFPLLGTGLGGLNKVEVKKVMEKYLCDATPLIEIYIHEE